MSLHKAKIVANLVMSCRFPWRKYYNNNYNFSLLQLIKGIKHSGVPCIAVKMALRKL